MPTTPGAVDHDARRHKIEQARRPPLDRADLHPLSGGQNGLVEKIAEAAKDKRIEGAATSATIEPRGRARGHRPQARCHARGGAEPDLAQHPAQSSFPANMLAIRGGRPEVLGLKDIITSFITFREEVITRRTKFELNKARDRAHILLGLVIAVTNLDEVVRIIRGAPNPPPLRAALLAREWPMGEIASYIRLVEAIEEDAASLSAPTYRLSEMQVKAILDLRLHRLTALGRDEIGDELEGLAKAIESLDSGRPREAVRRDAQELVAVRAIRHAAPVRNHRRRRQHRR
jgi:DNA gyrase subunit A